MSKYNLKKMRDNKKMLDEGNEKIEFRKLDYTKTATVDRTVNIGLVFFPLDRPHHVEVITCSPGVYRFTPRKRSPEKMTAKKGKYYFETELVDHPTFKDRKKVSRFL